MKRLALLASVLAAGGAFAQADVKLAELERAELRNAVRPGKPDGSGFWNRNAQWFMYPPAFNFDEVFPKSVDACTRFHVGNKASADGTAETFMPSDGILTGKGAC